jgi:hypothetical protein
MEKGMADFCDVNWGMVLDAVGLEVVMEATRITSVPHPSSGQVRDLFRLPRAVVAEALKFVEQHASACLRSRQEVPSMPIPDPWDAKRRQTLDVQVLRGITQMARLAKQHWGISKQEAAVSQSAARLDLLSEVASQWEAGQRSYYQALQKGDANPPVSTDKQKATKANATGKRPRKRGKTTEERLQDLLSTPSGCGQILGAETIDGIAALIDRSHGSVAGSSAWKKRIKSMLETLEVTSAIERLKYDDERLDRRSDRRRK